MVTKTAVVAHSMGLHARPAGQFIRMASSFASRISIGRPGAAGVNAKSIVNVLMQGFSQGTTVEITAEGEDEQQAVDALVTLLLADEE